MKRIARAGIVLLAGVYGSACDDAPAPPPELVNRTATTEPAAPARPTTQEILEGPRKSITLADLPLTVRAPAGWSVKPAPGVTAMLLAGPTPYGEAAVALADRPITTAAKFDIVVNGAKRELEQFPQSIKLVELRTIEGGAKVLERQRVGLMPRPSEDDPPGLKLSPPLNWTLTVFVPRGADYDTYELNFIGLTVDQYETDEALLREIINSLAVQGLSGGGSSTGTGPVTAPVPPPL